MSGVIADGRFLVGNLGGDLDQRFVRGLEILLLLGQRTRVPSISSWLLAISDSNSRTRSPLKFTGALGRKLAGPVLADARPEHGQLLVGPLQCAPQPIDLLHAPPAPRPSARCRR